MCADNPDQDRESSPPPSPASSSPPAPSASSPGPPDASLPAEGLLSRPDNLVSDAKLIERYPFGSSLRPEIVEALRSVMQDPQARRREKIAAAKALAAIDKLNMEQEKRAGGTPDTLVVVQQQQAVAVNPAQQAAAEVAAMDATILPAAVLYGHLVKPEGSNGNGQSNGNGNGHKAES